MRGLIDCISIFMLSTKERGDMEKEMQLTGGCCFAYCI